MKGWATTIVLRCLVRSCGRSWGGLKRTTRLHPDTLDHALESLLTRGLIVRCAGRNCVAYRLSPTCDEDRAGHWYSSDPWTPETGFADHRAVWERIRREAGA